MKNINFYDEDAFDFYKDLYERKEDLNLIARLNVLDNDVQALFNAYNEGFDQNTLENINAHGYIDPERADFLSLYNYSSAALKKLQIRLTTTETGRESKCQNCTINNVNTFDHILPQNEFPEFSVHPRNLVCCCGDCNSRRNNVWRNNGVRTTLNLYLDELPQIQYLYANVEVNLKVIKVEFHLRNVNNQIDNGMFNLLREHYRRLNLLERFSVDSDTVVSSFRAVLEPLSEFTPAKVQEIARRQIEKEQIAFGLNYWQSILKLALLDNEAFINEFGNGE